jgi:hypothetical protein
MLKSEMLKQLENELSENVANFPRSKLFKILKENLSKMGYWKNKARGNPKKGYDKMMIKQDLTHNNK